MPQILPFSPIVPKYCTIVKEFATSFFRFGKGVFDIDEKVKKVLEFYNPAIIFKRLLRNLPRCSITLYSP
jgi:hypothetical protein